MGAIHREKGGKDKVKEKKESSDIAETQDKDKEEIERNMGGK